MNYLVKYRSRLDDHDVPAKSIVVEGYESEKDAREAFLRAPGMGLCTIIEVEEALLDKAWEKPMKRRYWYAPNEGDAYYVADRDFARWLRYTLNGLMSGWDETLHNKLGFKRFCMYAQFQFLDLMEGVALWIRDKESTPWLADLYKDDSGHNGEYEDNDLSTIEWGDEQGQDENVPHLMFHMNVEFRQPDTAEQWFIMSFTHGDSSGSMMTTYYSPERARGVEHAFRDKREVGRFMLKEVKSARKELEEFWDMYQQQYGVLSEEPEKWRG